MKNFGETLAYWYLRLNGFFPISNFVLHRSKTNKYSADTDLLAVRFPYVYEEIGGQNEDWDNTFSEWGLNLNKDIIGLIVEVKTGRIDTRKIEQAFDWERLEYNLQRLGFWPRPYIEGIVEELTHKPLYRDPTNNCVVVAKILITDNPDSLDEPPTFSFSLDEVENFIVQRMQHYIDIKLADRLFFPSDLLQYLIWKQSKPRS